MKGVQLLPWQPEWALLAQQLAASLREAMPQAEVEHIGSTAVPGLCAKPVIDLMLGVRALDEVQPERLAQLGYRYRPEYEAAIPQRRYFVAEAMPWRVHLHALVQGERLWAQHLQFRELLRGDAQVCAAYARLKVRLAERHADDKAAYQAGKDPFIEALLRS